LIEILIVVVIIGLIASLVAPNLLKNLTRSKREIAKAQIEMLSSAIKTYMKDVGECPGSLEELLHSDKKGWNGPYLAKEKVPLDPWNKPFVYKCPGDHGAFDLFSYGADGKEGGERDNEDIVSWK
jgi:general secretion pathway protein G